MKGQLAFEEFKRAHQAGMEKWCLQDWDVTYKLCHLPDARAVTEADADNHMVKVKFAKNRDMGTDEIGQIARHEVGHLFFADYANLATRRFVAEDALDREEERMCVVMEKQ